MRVFLTRIALLTALLLVAGSGLMAQVTTATLKGLVQDASGEPLIGATIQAVHTPSGTYYGNTTNEKGYFTIPGMRIGGPYKVTVSYTGFKTEEYEDIMLTLGTAADLRVKMVEEAVDLTGVEVVANRSEVFNSDRTGAATNISREALGSMPTISRNLRDFTRLTPQANGSSFGGQDNRLNNITIDGSLFNNSFGLSGEPGGRTNVAPVSLDAIEAVQVNIAPYDIRQSGFTGAGINAVTRSGTNEFSGSVFYNLQNQNFVGDKAKGKTVTVNDFNQYFAGFRVGGPIIKNKLFFFLNGELEDRTDPFQFTSLKSGQTAGGNITSVADADLQEVSKILREKAGYETGPYEGYDFKTNAKKIIAKIDWNINNSNKLSVRYNFLDSYQDKVISNSSSLGFGSRSTNQSLSYQNSNYVQLEKINSVIAELNTLFGAKMSNNLKVGFTRQVEDRAVRNGDEITPVTDATVFPLIEILSNSRTYISAGFEPFTPYNQLSYNSLQLSDNFTMYLNKHTLTAVANVERLEFRNVFFPGSQGVFVYNSLADFKKDLETTDKVNMRRFQYRYSALPGEAEPVQPTKVTYAGVGIQDEFAVNANFNLTAGIRVDVPFFDATGYENTKVSGETYKLQGESIKINTAKLPDPKPLISPRLGFNWDVTGKKEYQVRGGTGLFTGRPAFVWISNQIGNNGVITGFTQIDNDTTGKYQFTKTPGDVVTNKSVPSSYELAVTDPNFKFPQIWRTNVAVDAKLPWGFVGTLEFIYNKNVNAIDYFDVNQEDANPNMPKQVGADQRPLYTGYSYNDQTKKYSRLSSTALNNAVRINDATINAIYLTNTNQGSTYSVTASLERNFVNGLFVKAAYNYGRARDLINAGSIAAGSFTGLPTTNGNNYKELAFSDYDNPHRAILALSYKKDLFKAVTLSASLFYEARTQGRTSYVYAGDMNGDNVQNNDLIYVPRDANQGNEIRFSAITVNYTENGQPQTKTISPEDQAKAFEAYIQQDDYLSSRRGQYAERNGLLLPWIHTMDFSFTVEPYWNLGGKRNSLQFRLDIFNVGNMINSDWGVSQRVIQNRILSYASIDADTGQALYRMATTGTGKSTEPVKTTFETNAFISDVWRMQLGIRYNFN